MLRFIGFLLLVSASFAQALEITQVRLDTQSFEPVKGEQVIIHYQLSAPAQVSLQIYDGRDLMVRQIDSKTKLAAGAHRNRNRGTGIQGVSTYDYDDRGRITKQTNPLGEETIYTYTNHNLTQIEIGRTVAEGAGQLSQFIYDGKDHQIEIKRQDDTGVFQTYQSVTYDSRDQLLSQTRCLGPDNKLQL